METTPAKICGAKTSAGTPCKRAPMRNGRCHKHGGATPAGIASPHWKTGLHSSVMPVRLKATFEEAMKQEAGALLDFSAEIALYQARMRELIGTIDLEAAGDHLLVIRKLWREFNTLNRVASTSRSNQEKLGPRIATLALELGDAIEKGAEEALIWKDIDNVINQGVKLGKYEMDRQERAQKYVANEHVLALFTELMNSVHEHVIDQEALKAIQADMLRLIGE